MLWPRLSDALFDRYGAAAVRSQNFWNSNGGEPEEWVNQWFGSELGENDEQERRTVGPAPFPNIVTTKNYQNATHEVDIALQTPDNTNALRLTRQVVVERANIPGAEAEASGGASAAGETSAVFGGGAKKKRRRAPKWSQSMASQLDEEMRPVASPSTHEEIPARSSDFPWRGSVGNARPRASGSTDG